MTPSVADRGRSRRGALLLLVLTTLTLFMMIGTLLLVIATRTRTAARAFAGAANSMSADTLHARVLLDDALLVLLRGSKAQLPPEIVESMLEDRYGTDVLTGTAAPVGPITNGPLQGMPAVLEASLTGVRDASGTSPHPCDLNGRILTLKPDPADGDVASYRILRTIARPSGAMTVYLANLPTSRSPVLPRRPCEVLINGREYAVSGTSPAMEAYDSFDKDPWLAAIPLVGSEPATSGTVRPSFGPSIPLATGSAPGMAGRMRTLACDNDNDGFADGVWISGTGGFLPPRPSPLGGRLSYEVSYLVLDLDGRLNLNAHGSLSHAAANAADWPASIGGSDVSGVPVGLNYGPADVDASRIVATGTAAKGVPGFPGRWPSVAVSTQMGPPPNANGVRQRRATPSIGGSVGGRYGVEAAGGPGRQGSTLAAPARWALAGRSPTDLKSRLKMFLSATSAGVPTLVFFTPDASVGDFVESPYELRLDGDGCRVQETPPTGRQGSAADNPYTVGELERILRPFDADAGTLPPRLAAILDDQAERSRLVVTTDSWDTPAMTGEAMGRVRGFLRQFAPPTAASPSAGNGEATVYDVTSPDVSAGLRFDVNRPLEYPQLSPASIARVKARFCRHLFTLLVALGQPATRETAQWVANVCDFRDPDSTMTLFRYDTNPLDGWTPGSDAVFGAERPEVLITETLAWQGHLSVVLYHPWAARMLDRQAGGDLSRGVPVETVDPALAAKNDPAAVDLAARNPAGEPVWRLRVEGGGTFTFPDAATGDASQCVLPANGYLCVQTSAGAGTTLPTLTAASLTPAAGAASASVILERLADPTRPKSDAKGSDAHNPYVAVDTGTVTISEDQSTAAKSQRDATRFWRQQWTRVRGPQVPAAVSIPVPWFHWPNRPFIGVAELALVPSGDANGMLAADARPSPVLAPNSLILDACTVASRFAGSDVRIGRVAANGGSGLLDEIVRTEEICSTQLPRWREPGRVNVNTIVSNTGNALAVLDDAVWKAAGGPGIAGVNGGRNPFDPTSGGKPAESVTKLLALGTPGDTPFVDPENQAPPARQNDDFFRYATAIRLSNVATTRSSVFAVWITLKTTDSSPGASGPTFRRLFAIVDRSIPVGFSRGETLNVRDTVRLQRFLD